MQNLNDIKKDAQTRMQKSVDALKHELTRLRTGRASTALIELWVASRTDPELSEHLDRFQKEISKHLK